MALKLSIFSRSGGAQITLREPAVATPAPAVTEPGQLSAMRRFFRQSLLFVLIGILLYAGLYVMMERLVYGYTVRNRFFAVKTAPYARYDYVLLGASRAVVLDYEDMNARLEEMTGASILNLSTLGGGITVNRLLLDYFLARHETEHVVYFLDSFIFYSPEWNEDRVTDVSLYRRAPFDPVLARLLFERPATRPVALGYLLGFYKINNPDWFKLDISEEEATRFDKTYRPVPQIDRQRMAYLYPEEIDPQRFQHYLAEFTELIRQLRAQNISVTIIKPPIPEQVHSMLPQEEQFDRALRAALEPNDIAFYDFSLVSNDREFFFNTDHLNRAGVLQFYENYLVDVLSKQE